MDPITPLGPWGHMFLLHLLSYSQHMESSYQSESIFHLLACRQPLGNPRDCLGMGPGKNIWFPLFF